VTGSVQGSVRFDKRVHLQVSGVSATAREAVEKVGGSVTTVYYNKLGLRALLMPDWFEKKGRLLPRPARPHPKKKDQFDFTGSLPPTRELPAVLTA
jgi:large subunit ribosomal protein L15